MEANKNEIAILIPLKSLYLEWNLGVLERVNLLIKTQIKDY